MKRSKKLPVILLCLSLLLCQVLGCTGVGGEMSPTVPPPAEAPAAGGEKITRILVLGLDRAAELTDSILVVSLTEPSGQLQILQLPRDTYANYTEKDYKKLNGAYRRLGLDGMRELLSRALGVPIHRTVVLELDAVSHLVDAVGGVEVELPEELYPTAESEMGLQPIPGPQHLEGRAAEYFLRFRSGYADADLGRMDTQKLFLKAYLQKCRSLGGGTLLKLAAAVFPHLRTDLTLPEAVRLMQLVTSSQGEELIIETAPGQAVQGSSGAWYFSLRRAECKAAVERLLRADRPIPEEEFDPDGIFDRRDMPEFHRIYQGKA